MKLEESQNFCVKLTNHIRRYYCSVEPIINRNEIDYHEIKIGNQIKKNRIVITDILKNENKLIGVRIGYINENNERVEKDILLSGPTKLKFITGNPERYFTEDMTFEIVQKNENTVIGGEKILYDLR